ncbi:hypothetical protein NLN78_03430 [Citrobacter portucalensis]|uniref:hypothetical protein n=1 Tax=Citrobacter portucalensis TaxID=1639133 RepID=UPI00226ADA86|nr:hypothetical protein [Citrobacter portucalensis]MCX8972612.1 hypothetical protein [Citrobacter portucalensis]
MKPTYEELELQLEESQREFRAADATIHNLELKLTDMAVQLANAESKCRELAADNERAMDSLKQADAAVKLAHEKFSALVDENMALKSGHYNGMVLPETPATDAFLAEVRAQGVEMYADTLDRAADDAERNGFDDGMRFLRAESEGVRKFAAQLRKGPAL